MGDPVAVPGFIFCLGGLYSCKATGHTHTHSFQALPTSSLSLPWHQAVWGTRVHTCTHAYITAPSWHLHPYPLELGNDKAHTHTPSCSTRTSLYSWRLVGTQWVGQFDLLLASPYRGELCPLSSQDRPGPGLYCPPLVLLKNPRLLQGEENISLLFWLESQAQIFLFS
jgi:hypothetical protein